MNRILFFWLVSLIIATACSSLPMEEDYRERLEMINSSQFEDVQDEGGQSAITQDNNSTSDDIVEDPDDEQSDDPGEEDNDDQEWDRIVPPNLPSHIANVLKRALQIATISWTPVDVVPHNFGFFSAGVEMIGIPYSSVKEMDKFVGLDVSFKTFMTAVHNPRSVLYTENVGKHPYNGTNCAAYYGTVCSSTVDYALGLKANYTTSMIDTLSFFTKAPVQSPESVDYCDVLWSKGHNVLVYDIMRNPDGSILIISILESSTAKTGIYDYLYDDFVERWKDMGWVIYKYDFSRQADYTPSPFIRLYGEEKTQYYYNEVLCPSRGDCAVYREGEDVVINILDNSFSRLVLCKDGEDVEEMTIEERDVVLHNLGYGSYSAYASDGLCNQSEEIHFEVVDTDVSAVSGGSTVSVEFKSQYGQPIYMALCNEIGDKYMIKEFSVLEQTSGRAKVKFPEKISKCYCKVYFATENGTVTNSPVLVKR